MKTTPATIFFSILVCILFAPSVLARNNSAITDCYIENFDSRTAVQTDASLLIIEDVLTDCGTLGGKHGIFRVIPEQTKTDSGTFTTPVKIVSITDENNNPRQYTESRDPVNHTVSYKIGNPNITISGKNLYRITYSVENAVRALKNGKDELYWNLLGNFWEMEIDKFSARVTFPNGINQDNADVYLYSGDAGEKQNLLTDWKWSDDNALNINSKLPLSARQGVTLSVTFPDGTVNAYQPGFFDLYGIYFWLMIPALVFILAFAFWVKHGRDPVVNKTIIPEFDIPDNMPPAQLALLDTNGVFSDKMIAASIVDLAVKKHISIKEIKKTWSLGKNDYELTKNATQATMPLSETESAMLGEIFKNGTTVKISDLKERFYLSIPKIRRLAVNQLVSDGYIADEGLSLKKIFLLAGVLSFWAAIFLINSGMAAVLSMAASGIILVIFGLIMPKRTPKGAELNWRIQGFKLYMKTAEKYRQQFNEKENIFEKFLPYAMVFGMAKLWIKKMEQLYGRDYFTNYHPAWYTGTAVSGFNADNFVSQINSLSASIAASTGSRSGAGGSGFSGGGGGGGGGGSW